MFPGNHREHAPRCATGKLCKMQSMHKRAWVRTQKMILATNIQMLPLISPQISSTGRLSPQLIATICNHLHASQPIALDLYVIFLHGSRHLTKFAWELVNVSNLYRNQYARYTNSSNLQDQYSYYASSSQSCMRGSACSDGSTADYEAYVMHMNVVAPCQ